MFVVGESTTRLFLFLFLLFLYCNFSYPFYLLVSVLFILLFHRRISAVDRTVTSDMKTFIHVEPNHFISSCRLPLVGSFFAVEILCLGMKILFFDRQRYDANPSRSKCTTKQQQQQQQLPLEASY
jgi:hypothetical protein